jgi:hypothetical protein
MFLVMEDMEADLKTNVTVEDAFTLMYSLRSLIYILD